MKNSGAMEVYLMKRIKALLARSWTKQEIAQQLSGLDSRKRIEKLVEQVSA